MARKHLLPKSFIWANETCCLICISETFTHSTSWRRVTLWVLNKNKLTIRLWNSTHCLETFVADSAQNMRLSLRAPSFFTKHSNPMNPYIIRTKISFLKINNSCCSPSRPHNENVERVFFKTQHTVTVSCDQQWSSSLLRLTLGDHFVDPCTSCSSTVSSLKLYDTRFVSSFWQQTFIIIASFCNLLWKRWWVVWQKVIRELNYPNPESNIFLISFRITNICQDMYKQGSLPDYKITLNTWATCMCNTNTRR
jgi:hypothetical protein